MSDIAVYDFLKQKEGYLEQMRKISKKYYNQNKEICIAKSKERANLTWVCPLCNVEYKYGNKYAHSKTCERNLADPKKDYQCPDCNKRMKSSTKKIHDGGFCKAKK
jgi:hypothetical protein